jgi:branched-chain amino acid transport system permease protein
MAGKDAIRIGLLGSLAAWHVCLIGMVEAFSKRPLIGTVVVFGWVLLAALMVVAGNLAARRSTRPFVSGLIAGGIVGVSLALLAVLLASFNLRTIFVAATPRLVQLLAPGEELGVGLLLPIVVGLAAGLFGAALTRMPVLWRNVILTALLTTVLVGLLREVLVAMLPRDTARLFFTSSGLQPLGAALVFVLSGAVAWAWRSFGTARAAAPGTVESRRNPWRIAQFGIAALLLLSFPLWSSLFLANVVSFVGLYIIMGLGLNLVVGFAGLLDLGYVGFFAIGAYTVAVLTSPDLGIASLTWWQALPFALGVALLAGVILGLPVLRMRGDYLAIATLGFGEIIRLLALSDWLKPYLGGAQGVTRIARPTIGSFTFDSPQSYYYLILIGCVLAWIVAARIKDSRLGRAWMSIREDEDVAQAMGINRVSAKLTAFAIGALFGGLAGAIFAAMVNSVVPTSFGLLISINVVALIIIGGLGSLPGVVVGALVLVGLPELLREFNDYRLLVYGVVLVVMMLYRPQGLWPEETIARAMREASAQAPVAEPQPTTMTAAPASKTEA